MKDDGIAPPAIGPEQRTKSRTAFFPGWCMAQAPRQNTRGIPPKKKIAFLVEKAGMAYNFS